MMKLSDKNIEIKVNNIKNPPEKMQLMFEAVSDLIREQCDISTIKVQDITKRAGIGKGTAYEYFSSKDELIANALMYEYDKKMQKLAESAFEPDDFRERCYRIMDWIYDNKEYNQMFSQLMNKNFGGPVCCENFDGPNEKGTSAISSDGNITADLEMDVHEYIYSLIDSFMEYGYEQGAFDEKDVRKRSLALLSSMIEYSFVVMGSAHSRYMNIGDGDMRMFIYKSLISALKN